METYKSFVQYRKSFTQSTVHGPDSCELIRNAEAQAPAQTSGIRICLFPSSQVICRHIHVKKPCNRSCVSSYLLYMTRKLSPQPWCYRPVSYKSLLKSHDPMIWELLNHTWSTSLGFQCVIVV